MTPFPHFGPCAHCGVPDRVMPLTVPGHEARNMYCSLECRADAGDRPHCSVVECQGPADYTTDGGRSHRCNRCAPDACQTCWVWGQKACRIHRSANAQAALARGYKPELKVVRGEFPVFVDAFDGCHPMHDGPRPFPGEDEPTKLELEPVR